MCQSAVWRVVIETALKQPNHFSLDRRALLWRTDVSRKREARADYQYHEIVIVS